MLISSELYASSLVFAYIMANSIIYIYTDYKDSKISVSYIYFM